jgi:hypothetical protein
LGCELEVGLAPASAGFAAREGVIFSRNFANIFFNMTSEGASVCESPGFAIFDIGSGFPLGKFDFPAFVTTVVT